MDTNIVVIDVSFVINLRKMVLLLSLISLVLTGCSRNKADVQLQQVTEPIPQKITECKVSLTESALRNSLLAPVENIKYSIL